MKKVSKFYKRKNNISFEEKYESLENIQDVYNGL
uniref:Uncharacterized protein n=1 Tax=Anguilla anguilla TaxID=7936 RepID=A0A0E9UUL6_ANGAN